MEIFGQIIGIVAMILTVLSFQMKSNRMLFLVQVFSGALFTVSFFLLNEFPSAAANLVGVLRCVFFLVFKNRKNPTPYIVIQALFVAMSVLTYVNPLSFLVAAAQIVGTALMWADNGKALRIGNLLFTSPAWLINNIIAGAIGGILCEAFNMTSMIVSLIRYRKTGFDGVSEQTATPVPTDNAKTAEKKE